MALVPDIPLLKQVGKGNPRISCFQGLSASARYPRATLQRLRLRSSPASCQEWRTHRPSSSSHCSWPSKSTLLRQSNVIPFPAGNPSLFLHASYMGSRRQRVMSCFALFAISHCIVLLMFLLVLSRTSLGILPRLFHQSWLALRIKMLV